MKDGVVDHDPFEHGLDNDPTTLDQRPAGQGALGVEEILEAGADKARAIAAPIVAEVREVMGVGPIKRSVGPAA